MPISIDVYDFKCFNHLRNGITFTDNPSQFVPNLVGNIGEFVKIEFSVNIKQTAYTEGAETWNIRFEAGDKVRLVRSAGSFYDDAVQVGDDFEYYEQWDIRRLLTTPAFTANVDFISGDGSTLVGTRTATDRNPPFGERTNVGIVFDQRHLDNRNAALFLKFGLIENEESFNFQSKTTGSPQIYYRGGLQSDTPASAESLGVIKDWVAGNVTFEAVSGDPDFKAAKFIISHVLVLNPFYILDYQTFIDNGTVPEILDGDNSLKYAAELEFRKTLSDTRSSKVQVFDNLNGFVGWYGENFNGLNTKYEILSIAYSEDVSGDPLDGVNINRATKITALVRDVNGPITDYACGVYLYKKPTSEDDYIGTTTDVFYNFIYKYGLRTAAGGSTPTVNTFITGGGFLVIEFTIDYTTDEKLRITTDDEYIFLVQVEDPTIAVGDSDRTMLLAHERNYVDVDYLSEFISVPSYRFLQHGQNLTDNQGQQDPVTSNEDGILLTAVIGSNSTRNVIINGLSLKLLAYNSVTGESFELDSYPIDIGDLLISGGVQQIEVNTTRGYPLDEGDEFNLVRITTGSQVGDYRQYPIQIGQKIKWQDWLLNPSADDVFFDAGFPNNNLNYKASNYSDKEDYDIKVALVVNVTGDDDLGRSITGDFIHYGADIPVLDYGESDDGVSGVIETYDLETGNSLAGNILYNGKDTLFRAIFSNASAMQYGLHRIEPSQNPGDGILELSSLFDPLVPGLLKPLTGQTRLKFDLIGSDLTTECLVDGSKIQEGTTYKLSARTGTVPFDAIFTFQTNKLPTGTGNNAFNPSVTYTGAGSVYWIFENGYIFEGAAVNDIDGSLTGLDGTAQEVGLYVQEPENLTVFIAQFDGLLGDIDFTGLSGLSTITVNNNALDSFVLDTNPVYASLNFANNSLGPTVSFDGLDFTATASLNISANSLISCSLAIGSGTFSVFNISQNAILGTFNGAALPVTQQAQVLINNNSYTALTPPSTARIFTASSNPVTGALALSGLTLYGARAELNIENLSISSISSYPSMDAGSTLGAFRLGGNGGISQAYDDTWVTSYQAANLKMNSSGITNLITTASGTLQILDVRSIPAITINVGSTTWDSVFVQISATGLTSTTSLIFPSFSGKILGGIEIGGNFVNSLNFSGADFFGSRDFRIANNPNITGITLPSAVSGNVDSLDFSNNNVAISAGYTISALGGATLTQNDIEVNFVSSLLTTAEVNRILVELDAIATGGFTGRTIDVSGSNPAPDGVSGGNNGTAAVASLISKGFTVTTN